jgi:hypothetical protein
MPVYRVNFLNPNSTQVVFFKEFSAADDEAALRVVRGRPLEQTAELWCGNRSVGRFVPER